jgi:hypothetical protein
LLINIDITRLISQPNLKIDDALWFILQTNGSLVGILCNNRLRHSAVFYRWRDNSPARDIALAVRSHSPSADAVLDEEYAA